MARPRPGDAARVRDRRRASPATDSVRPMNQDMARRHRDAFAAAMLERSADPVALLWTGTEILRNGDSAYPFRPESNFWYLTGFREPDALLVLRPAADKPYTLFVPPRDPAKEVWFGRRVGVDGALEQLGADQAFSVEQLHAKLPELLAGADVLHYRTGRSPELDTRVLGLLNAMRDRTRDGTRSPEGVVDPGVILGEQRLRKSDDELAVMRRAAAITRDAHLAAMKALGPGVAEYEIEAIVNGTFRRAGGWGPGYTSICAGGANACVLHYITNDAQMGGDDLMLLDAGCEFDGYTADVTRCFPASGTFTAVQRELYDVVLAAETAACDSVRPGATFHSVHDVALRALVEGMLAHELLTGDVDENIENGGYRRYFMHRTSHWLGIDVHDVGAYYTPEKDSRPLEPGMVLTVEPGLYVSPDDDQAPERYRGIGIRIEDDVLVTADGHENLTGAIPKTTADVEAAC